MSIFYCTHCDKYADSDNGCGEINDTTVCDRCADEAREPSEDGEQDA